MSPARPLSAAELCHHLSKALSALVATVAPELTSYERSSLDGLTEADLMAASAVPTTGPFQVCALLREARVQLEAAPPLCAGSSAQGAAPRAELAALAAEAAVLARTASGHMQAVPLSSRLGEAISEANKPKLRHVDADSGRDWKELFVAILEADLPGRLLENLTRLPFEARKDAVRLMRALLRCGVAEPLPHAEMVGYVRGRREMVRLLLQGCGNPEDVIICGQTLRDCARYSELVTLLLQEERAALELMALVRHPSFDVACDAFASLRELLLQQKEAAAVHIEENFSEFFRSYNELLQAEDYVTRRQALRLLGEMLLDGHFTAVMIKYVTNYHFLRIHMNLLLDPSPMIQLGAFHVLKIFVANPEKPPRVEQILQRNARGLRRVLEALPQVREQDEDLAQDVWAVLEILSTMPPASYSPSSTGSSTPTTLIEDTSVSAAAH